MHNRRFRGMAYPITKHPKGFFRNGDTDVDEIKSSIATIILTEPKERIFEPHFGFNYKSINLNAPREIVEGEFRVRVANIIKRWEKRIQVEEIVVKLENMDNNLIAMLLIYFIDPVDIRTTHELIIYKSLGGIDGRKLPF
jgi:phage baseplate assembly protein W